MKRPLLGPASRSPTSSNPQPVRLPQAGMESPTGKVSSGRPDPATFRCPGALTSPTIPPSIRPIIHTAPGNATRSSPKGPAVTASPSGPPPRTALVINSPRRHAVNATFNEGWEQYTRCRPARPGPQTISRNRREVSTLSHNRVDATVLRSAVASIGTIRRATLLLVVTIMFAL